MRTEGEIRHKIAVVNAAVGIRESQKADKYDIGYKSALQWVLGG